MILGQEKLCKRIKGTTLDTFPRSILLVGATGSGKHMMCEYIASHLNIPMVDITNKLELSTINELYQKVEPHLYIIDVSKIGVKEENLILKFLEEPLRNSYILLLAITDNGILPTVVNRCQVWRMSPYSKDILKSFTTDGDDLLLSIAETPGQVIQLRGTNFNSMVELADKIINKIEVASAYNTLTLSNNIGFKGEMDKMDIRLFISLLMNRIVEKSKQIDDVRLMHAYILTKTMRENCETNNVDLKAIFEKYLLDLRLTMRGGII